MRSRFALFTEKKDPTHLDIEKKANFDSLQFAKTLLTVRKGKSVFIRTGNWLLQSKSSTPKILTFIYGDEDKPLAEFMFALNETTETIILENSHRKARDIGHITFTELEQGARELSKISNKKVCLLFPLYGSDEVARFLRRRGYEDTTVEDFGISLSAMEMYFSN